MKSWLMELGGVY